MTNLFPDLKRPQYPPSPEVLLSALAWSVIPRNPSQEKVGLIYSRESRRRTSGITIAQTMPKSEDNTLEAFRARLQASGLVEVNGYLSSYAAEAVTNSLLGLQPKKATGKASSAIGLCGALLQDPVGSLATKNPPNFAQLLNTMYALGGRQPRPCAAERWFDVAKFHASGLPLKTFEAALRATTLHPYLQEGTWPPASPDPIESSLPGELPDWWQRDVLDANLGTPFSWFRTSWDRLCSREWYEKLSPRRWTGWAVCVLRNAIGFAFLWEANFFVELARGIEDQDRDPATVARWAMSPTKPLVPYRRGSISQMDVKPSIERLLAQGLACRKAILELTDTLDDRPDDLAGLVRELRKLKHESVGAALAGDGEKGGLTNLIETVRYSLLARSNPETPDHHGLLRIVSRNYTHVAPGPEWIVVMSAVAAQEPSAIVRLGDVQRSLEAIGFKPRIDFLLGELERAGLCASACDGDEGIEINLGFGRK